MKNFLWACLSLSLIGCAHTPATEAQEPFAEFRGAPEVARAAVSRWVEKGEAAIPELKEGMASDSIAVSRYSMEALSRITGQWGWNDGLIWKRSVDEAKNQGKPMMVLHLFGNFDEEFC